MYQGRQTPPNMEPEVNYVYLIHIISLLTLVYLVWVDFQAEYFLLNDIPPCLTIPVGLSREAELRVLRLSKQASRGGALK